MTNPSPNLDWNLHVMWRGLLASFLMIPACSFAATLPAGYRIERNPQTGKYRYAATISNQTVEVYGTVSYATRLGAEKAASNAVAKAVKDATNLWEVVK